MPYIGKKYKYDDKLITTKLYGPNSLFSVSSEELEKLIASAVSRTIAEKWALAYWVARNVAGDVTKDENVRWVECEVMYADGSLFGGVAELEVVE